MEQNSNYKIALLIPTLNAGKYWEEFLETVNSQSLGINFKIILDSGSTDGTDKLAEDKGFNVLRIDKRNFDHGYARQVLADACSTCDILIYLTQDCILACKDSLKNLVEAFSNADVGLAYGRQLPRRNAKLLESHGRIFNYPSQSRLKSLSDKVEMGIKTASCSNSFAAYRRTALNDVGGFPLASILGEDVIVGGKMLIKGWKIAYVATAESYHSHDYTITEEFKRYFDIGVFHKMNDWLLEEFGSASGEGMKYLKSELSVVLKKNPLVLPKMVGSIFAKWLGYKLGLNYSKLSGGLVKKLSMHKHYWDKHTKVKSNVASI
ncbi:glycosyltransferase [Mucilaginibacter aquatilis]|uniref:Glycosyltransferase n=1 Tax=Mucilaginibacter aquatilis TaxID=1517760 RepID=A0A6I4IQI7_9SPHI|nr:glycosyltransferase family 2 protein [Mucilaginibacter aquatilis]MVN91204.1 glycosyltransferase [Mucilaginibacter aquatilis]